MSSIVESFSPSTEGGEDADLDYERHFTRFQEIIAVEHAAVDKRREALGRELSAWPPVDKIKRGGAQRPMYDTAGVALSGGGIRSAAFCLGALQSLALTQRSSQDDIRRSLFDHVDYLSTVSGGGYIGSAVSAAMAQPTGSAQRFPFAKSGRVDDEPAVGHLRDYSNYLLPRGGGVWFDALGVFLRGLVTNLVFILAGIMFFAAIAVIAYPSLPILKAHGSLTIFFLAGIIQYFPRLQGITDALRATLPFLLTVVGLAILTVYLLFWALVRSQPRCWPSIMRNGLLSDVRGLFVQIGHWLVLIVLLSAVFDLTPFLIHGFVRLLHSSWADVVKTIAGVASSATAVVVFFKDRLSAALKSNASKPGSGAFAKRLAAHALVWLAALILPLLLWVAYLTVSAAGIADTGVSLFGWPCHHWGHWYCQHTGLLYAAIWMVLFGLTTLFARNANSLHEVYRDKLSKAFLADPMWRATAGSDAGDLIPRDDLSLSEISPATGGPYQLLNAAINLQGSVQENRRGRNASFFMFSSKFVGSDVTDYVDTAKVEEKEPHLNLGSAMAISGAAVSSDMGSSSIAALAPTLALLNLRLGYWMVNPRLLMKGARPRFRIRDCFRTYVLSEMFGLLDENEPWVYLTDGGHIENLGLYSLLKRHCSLIVVVDGECDPTLTFRALSICERYARIDLGVRIDLPWQEIAATGNATTSKAENGESLPPKGGPHCAVGTILYPGGQEGILLYVKALLTGDEPDYVVDYKMRNPVFPHESTGDQFFTEEQFEVYRALGFHALDGFLNNTRAYTAGMQVASDANGAGLSVPDFVKSRFPA